MNTRLSPESILFVGTEGLFKVVTPFNVVCVQAIGVFNVGDCVKVHKVSEGSQQELLYFVTNKYYSHHNFIYLGRKI